MSERLQKFLARAGVASRRHAELLITAGRVAVNNQIVTTLGSKVEPEDLVTVDGTLVSPPESSSWYLLHKPPGVVTTLSDPEGRPTVAELVSEIPGRVFPVGRLDWDAEGALLFTDDGGAAHRLLHPSFEVSRTYLVKVKGAPSDETLQRLVDGVRLEDGPARALKAVRFEAAERNTWIELQVGEGRPHLIKRLCAAVGHPVLRLFRPAQASVSVAGLAAGTVRPLTDEEVARVEGIASGERLPPVELFLPPRRHGRRGADEEESTPEESTAPVERGRPSGPGGARDRRGGKAPRREGPPGRGERRPEKSPTTGEGWSPKRGERSADRGARAGGGRSAPRRSWSADAEVPVPDGEEGSAGARFGSATPEEADQRPPRRERQGGEGPGRSGHFERGGRPGRGAGRSAGAGARGPRREGSSRGVGRAGGERGGDAGPRGARPPRSGGSWAGGERGTDAGPRGERPPRREGSWAGGSRGGDAGPRRERPPRREGGWAGGGRSGEGGLRGSRPAPGADRGAPGDRPRKGAPGGRGPGRFGARPGGRSSAGGPRSFSRGRFEGTGGPRGRPGGHPRGRPSGGPGGRGPGPRGGGAGGRGRGGPRSR